MARPFQTPRGWACIYVLSITEYTDYALLQATHQAMVR